MVHQPQALTLGSTRRTVIEFQLAGNPWPVFDAWAPAEGYRVIAQAGSRRLYQKGHGLLVAPMMLEVEVDPQGGRMRLQAWVAVNFFVRLCALFLVPSEMGIHSGGFRLLLPRRIARTAVNKLLAHLRQPQIP